MSKLKNNVNNITDDIKFIAKEHLRLLGIKEIKKISLFLGMLFSSIIIALLLFTSIQFCSIALVRFLNEVLSSQFWGYVLVAIFYLLAIIFLVVKMRISRVPLFTNLFVKLIVFVFGIQLNQCHNFEGLQNEEKNLQNKIDAGKIKFKYDIQLLLYALFERLTNKFIEFFSKRKKGNSDKNMNKKTRKMKSVKTNTPKHKTSKTPAKKTKVA